jgi:hypothetical protein
LKILIKYPTRSRPEIFFNTLERWISYLSGKNDYEIIVSCDDDDLSMQPEEVLEPLYCNESLSIYFSERKSKIEALNRDIEKAFTNWQILICASDDMIPVVENYDEIISNCMKMNYPDTDGILWYNDGFRKDMIEFFAMGRKYYDRFGYIYYPGYKSMRADAEMTDVAKMLGKVKYFDHVLVEHRHHSFKKNNSLPKDSLYIENHKYVDEDRKTYDERKATNFRNC